MTWKSVRILLGKNDRSDICNTFYINNEYVSDNHKIANDFCKYSSSVGANLAADIPDTDKNLSSYLSERNPTSKF